MTAIENLQKLFDAFQKDKMNKNREAIINFHYDSGMSLTEMAKYIDIHYVTLLKWKKKYGFQKTAFIYGHHIRYDVRTKAIAVEQMVKYKKKPKEIAEEYDVSIATVHNWFSKFAGNYKDLIKNLPDGVATLSRREKMIYGDQNIDFIVNQLQANPDTVPRVLELLHENGRQK